MQLVKSNQRQQFLVTNHVGFRLSSPVAIKPPFYQFSIGDVYLFHRSDPLCPAQSSLWGFYDRHDRGVIYLESSSRDLKLFKLRDVLPAEYCYARPSSRDELRDCMWSLGYFEGRRGSRI